MIPNGSKLELGTLSLSSETVKKGWNALSTLNNAIDGVKKVANDVVGLNIVLKEGNENEEIKTNKRNIQEKIQVGQIYGRLKNELKLIQTFEKETKSMGTLEIISINNNIDFKKMLIKWKRKIREKLLDIKNQDSKLIYNLTADDIGTIIIIEISPIEELNDSLNITYGELGPIEMDDSTKLSLSKSLKSGLIRFPIEIINDEFEELINPNNNLKELTNNENLLMTRDILLVTNDDVKVIRNGMSCSNSNFEKKVEWSAKYFGGNIHIQLNYSSLQEFTLFSGYDIHKQKITIKTTSRNARDLAVLTIRCLNIRHSVSLETIIDGVCWNTNYSIENNSNESEIDENKKFNIFAYIGRLEDEIENLEFSKEKLNEDKKLLQNEKIVLENELSETIAAYQDIIFQYQQEKDNKINNSNLNIKSNSYTNTFETNSSLLHGYCGTYPTNKEISKEKTEFHNDAKTQLSDPKIQLILEENFSLKQSLNQLNIKYQHELGAKQSTDCMHAEIKELRGKIEILNKEKEEFKKLSEKLNSDILIKNQELESIKSKQEDFNQTRNLEKIQEMQDRILQLQSQNSEKQQSIQTLSTEKSKLLKDFSSFKFDFEKLKEQHNQLNKKYISLTLETSKTNHPNQSNVPISQQPNDQINHSSKLENELEHFKKINHELNQTINILKSRIRKLAMIHTT